MNVNELNTFSTNTSIKISENLQEFPGNETSDTTDESGGIFRQQAYTLCTMANETEDLEILVICLHNPS